jgi:cellulose synthase/poly-beta-1,6-N-acetylglucosamine synthase-like glycosyltransferase
MGGHVPTFAYFAALGAAVVVAAGMFGMAAVTLWWTLHAWRTPETHEATAFSSRDDEPGLSFSLIVPMRHEPEFVVAATLNRLLDQSHPDLEVILSVGDDDPDTVALAHREAARAPDRILVSVDRSPVKSKPRQLNTALRLAGKDVVGIFDAESQAHPDLLRRIDATFREKGADVVQGGVQLMNYDSSWYALRNCMEYYFWYRSRLHLHAARGFIPLGGNTVFVRRALLEEVGGWDPDCLAEDCDLGVRLSTLGHRIAVAYEPELCTREETPDTIRALVRQRTRWNQGFLQVLHKGDWRRLPTPGLRLLARYTLWQPLLHAFAGVAIPVAILTTLFTRMPLPVTMVTFLPLLPTLAAVAFDAVALHDFGRSYGVRIRPVHYAKLVAGAPFYQVLLAWAAVRAVVRDRRGHDNWERTEHRGAHLVSVPIGEVA